MKFTLSTSGCFYTEDEAKLLREIGFDMRESVTEPGKWLDLGASPTIEFNTLDELIAFSEEWGKLVITPGGIEIYDDYRE